MRGWLWLQVMVGLVVGATAMPTGQGAGTTARRPGTVPAQGVTGPRDKPKPATGTARIRGLVVGADSGTPLRRAIVRLTGSDQPEGRATTTDAEGRWEIRDLPPGHYQIMAMKAGYITLTYGQREPMESTGKGVEVRDGQVRDGVNFSLPRGSVIAGRVVDEFGDPVSDVAVAPLQYRFAGGKRQLMAMGRMAETDDGGNFRLYGLPPGDYYLSAAGSSAIGESMDDRSGYATTYYPGTASAQQADKIPVGLGDEVSGLLFSLVPTRLATISGTVLDSHGKPVSGGFVSLMERSGFASGISSGGGGQVREDGSFSLANVAPGDYVLRSESFGSSVDVHETATATVTVSGEDIAGVTLVCARPMVIRGRVSFDVPPPAGRIGPTAIGVAAMAFDPLSIVSSSERQMAERLNDDWTFELRVSSGPVMVMPIRVPSGYSLKQVLWHGQDVTDGFPVKGSTTMSDVEVVLTAQSTSISGTVTDASGTPALKYVMLIFPEDSERWGPMSRYMSSTPSDLRGGFVIKDLPAGRYLAAALATLEDGEYANPELLERLRGVATPVTLAWGDQKAITLRMVEQ